MKCEDKSRSGEGWRDNMFMSRVYVCEVILQDNVAEGWGRGEGARGPLSHEATLNKARPKHILHDLDDEITTENAHYRDTSPQHSVFAGKREVSDFCTHPDLCSHQDLGVPLVIKPMAFLPSHALRGSSLLAIFSAQKLDARPLNLLVTVTVSAPPSSKIHPEMNKISTLYHYH
ncbi:jg22820 [Pararge aegeria aegeria]|uniref:Jg22820 protein n=1 Tax=Pararge aegeria aegeria TaxID=348720 RepID=A0A8S4RUG5_9NEOP|nr:jg22820 [Pararge aegeria aegeria]